jgi:mannose-6-phosphate isomerase-like protein (cupin superfamily)
MTKSIPICISNAFNTIKYLPNRTPQANDNNEGFCTLAAYRDGGIFLAHYAGKSEWERHTNGDEMVMVMEGETTLILLKNGEEIANLMTQGTLLVVPQNIWHRFESPKGVKVMTITPQPTDHSFERPE